MKIQEDSGSAFILNFHHLLGWKEHPRSWRKLCQLTDETASVEGARACFCVRGVCADSVSVLILKAAPLSESRSVTCGYTHLDARHKQKVVNTSRATQLTQNSLSKITSAAPFCALECETFLFFPHSLVLLQFY